MARNTKAARTLRHLLFAGLAVSLSGCGTMFGGSTKTISVTSVPSAVTVTSNPASGQFTTPTALTLERKSAYTLIATKEGYSEAQFQIRKSMRTGPLVLDILFTGLIGVIVDAATGGWYDLQPENVTISLERTDPNVVGPDVIEIHITEADSGPASFVVDASEAVQIEVVKNN
jgi:hypothetical protein